jgi:hypothetical protein
MNNYFQALESEYSLQLNLINKSSEREFLKMTLELINSIYQKLKEFISSIEFKTAEEEIDYFKNIKPKFQSDLIFYNQAYSISSRVPIGSVLKKKDYYNKYLDKMSTYFDENVDFINYFRANETDLDHVYFLRINAKEKKCPELLNSEIDYIQCTGYSSKISKILAYERLERYVNSELLKLDKIEDIPISAFSNENNLNFENLSWTDTKISLVELIYALQISGLINNGKTDIKTIAHQFEKIFNIDLGDIYKVYNEIKGRKSISKTKLLEKLQINLNKKIDDEDDF